MSSKMCQTDQEEVSYIVFVNKIIKLKHAIYLILSQDTSPTVDVVNRGDIEVSFYR